MIVAGDLARRTYIDDDGATWVVLAPQNVGADELWSFPRVGPPAIAAHLIGLGWPAEAANGVQAELVAAGILTVRQIHSATAGAQLDGMIRRAFRGSVQTVIDAFQALGGEQS